MDARPDALSIDPIDEDVAGVLHLAGFVVLVHQA